MAKDKKIRQAILRKMLRQEFIGAKHTSIENIPKGFPKHMRKDVADITRQLNKEGFIIFKPKPDAIHVSLNPKMLPKIRSELG
ncbi:MAG: hypothetical protein ACBZ72_02815 [Candidatus Bathyarchaeia archaeon]